MPWPWREAGQPGRRQRSAHRPRRRGGRPARGQVLDAGLKRGAHRRLPLPARVVGRAEGRWCGRCRRTRSAAGSRGRSTSSRARAGGSRPRWPVPKPVGLPEKWSSSAPCSASFIRYRSVSSRQLDPTQDTARASAAAYSAASAARRSISICGSDFTMRPRRSRLVQSPTRRPSATSASHVPGGQRLALEADAGAVQQGQEGVGPRRVARAAEGLGDRLEPGRQVAGGPPRQNPTRRSGRRWCPWRWPPSPRRPAGSPGLPT